MNRINKNVQRILEKNRWNVATYGENLNVVPIGIKAVLASGDVIFADNFLGKTKANIVKSGLVAISAYDSSSCEGYQLKGIGTYYNNGELYKEWRDTFYKLYNMSPKGIVYVKVDKVYITTPGDESGRELN